MDIQYLKIVKDNPTIGSFTNRGFTEEKIIEIENEFNSGDKFPQAFREYLFLAGDFNNFGFDDIDGIIDLQNRIKEDLQYCRFSIERPFFAFDGGDSQYQVIFLDETNVNPKVYLVCPYLAKEKRFSLVRPNDWHFKELVKESINRIKNNLGI